MTVASLRKELRGLSKRASRSPKSFAAIPCVALATLQCYCPPMKNTEGRVVHLGGTIQDITALIEAKRALDTAERQAILGRVAASVAHEINNPLLAIKTRLHTLKKTMVDRPETTEKLDLVMGQLDRIDRATRSMLGFSKQRAAHSKLLSYAEVIRAATDLFDPSFAARESG